MSEPTEKNKLTELVVKQNLLLWELSKAFLDLDKELTKINGTTVPS